MNLNGTILITNSHVDADLTRTAYANILIQTADPKSVMPTNPAHKRKGQQLVEI
jgi:hypothetical protein